MHSHAHTEYTHARTRSTIHGTHRSNQPKGAHTSANSYTEVRAALLLKMSAGSDVSILLDRLLCARATHGQAH
jgi:hypothetical protein